MKKTVFVIGVYTFLIFLICMGISWFVEDLPIILSIDVVRYKFLRSVLWVLELLPGVFFSGIMIAGGLKWKGDGAPIKHRFSSRMINRYKIIVIVSLGISFILSLTSEVFYPAMQRKVERIERSPLEFNDCITTARKLMMDEEYYLAFQYAKQACKIDPKSEVAKKALKDAEDSIEILKAKELYSKKKKRHVQTETLKRPLHERHALYTPFELVQKSKIEASKGSWFNSHYWATLALEACSGTDTIHEEAEDLANYAWNQLSLPFDNVSEQERDYYKKKKSGYSAFVNGDNLKAYYTFLSLSKSSVKGERDPDVIRFLALAKEDVETQYFFFDETENMDALASSHDIYFSFQTASKNTYVFIVRHAMEVKKSGGLIRYLEGVNVIRYDDNMNFMYSFSVPYAKVVAQSLSVFDDETLDMLGFNRKWDSIPILTLQSVDRDTEGLVSCPEYNYKFTQLPKEILAENKMYYKDSGTPQPLNLEDNAAFYERSSLFMIPMPYSDYDLIIEASKGPDKMNLLSLYKMIPKTVSYGFSKEAFTETLLTRTTFPLIALIMCMICAVYGWNYRITGKNRMFKFKWVLLIPVYGIIMYIVTNCSLYLFKLCDYVMVGLFGQGALFAAFIFYSIFFVGASILFVSRKS